MHAGSVHRGRWCCCSAVQACGWLYDGWQRYLRRHVLVNCDGCSWRLFHPAQPAWRVPVAASAAPLHDPYSVPRMTTYYSCFSVVGSALSLPLARYVRLCVCVDRHHWNGFIMRPPAAKAGGGWCRARPRPVTSRAWPYVYLPT